MRIKTVTIAVLAALCLFQAVLAQDDDPKDDAGANDDGADEDHTTDDPATVPPPVFNVKVQHNLSDVNNIKVIWDNHASFDDDVEYYYLTAQHEDSDDIITTPHLESNVRTYTLDNLMHNSYYNICLYAKMVENDEPIHECTDDPFYTIEYIRDDSLVVLFCVLGYIFCMILMGYLCWSYAKRKAEEEAEEEEEEAEKDGNEALLA